MGLGFEIIWPGKPDCEQGAMYERENLHQWKRKKLMTVYGTATSLYTLVRITSGHAYLPLAYILTYTIIYYIPCAKKVSECLQTL